MDLGTINVVDTKDTLSFKIIPPQNQNGKRTVNMLTGIRGFLNCVKVSDEKGIGLIRLSKVIYNGLELNSMQKIEFWNQLKEKENV